MRCTRQKGTLRVDGSAQLLDLRSEGARFVNGVSPLCLLIRGARSHGFWVRYQADDRYTTESVRLSNCSERR